MAAQDKSGPPPNPALIFDLARARQLPYILRAGVELDVFTAIVQANRTVPEIAQACKAAERGIRILCDSLTIMGFLTKVGNNYSLTPDTVFFLDSRSPAYMGKALRFLLHPKHFEKLEQLTETVRRGGAAGDEDTFAPEDSIWVDFARGVAPLMVPAAQAIGQLLLPELAAKPSPKVLDIAAGHGGHLGIRSQRRSCDAGFRGPLCHDHAEQHSARRCLHVCRTRGHVPECGFRWNAPCAPAPYSAVPGSGPESLNDQ